MNIAALSSGISLGFSAIALPQLRTFGNTTDDPNLYQPFTVTEESGSWIGKISAQQESEKHTSLLFRSRAYVLKYYVSYHSDYKFCNWYLCMLTL